jgi:hypothetical protein
MKFQVVKLSSTYEEVTNKCNIDCNASLKAVLETLSWKEV